MNYSLLLAPELLVPVALVAPVVPAALGSPVNPSKYVKKPKKKGI